MHCLDANVWIYYLDADLPEHELVEPAVRDLLETEQLFTTTVLQMEVVHYVANQLADSESILEEFLHLEGTTVAALTEADVRRGSQLLASYPNAGIGGRDASVLATMERYGVSTLWTHDRALANVAGEFDSVTVVDPVVDAGPS